MTSFPDLDREAETESSLASPASRSCPPSMPSLNSDLLQNYYYYHLLLSLIRPFRSYAPITYLFKNEYAASD